MTSAEEKLLDTLKSMNIQYGEVQLHCTYSRGKLVKVIVVDKSHVVLMD